MVRVEVVVTSLEDLEIAEQGGVDRIELASGLAEGAITPSLGLMKMVKKKANVPVHVMIRPRPGDYVYSQQEIEIMLEDITQAVELGVDGIITGVLTDQNEKNWGFLELVLKAAKPLKVTFHRAFDLLDNWEHALQKFIETYPDINRVMTSGKSDEPDLIVIKNLIDNYGTQISIVPSIQVKPENIHEIIANTNCKDIHTGI